MIIFNISGGLGNQFFQYAFGRHLSIKSNKQLYANVQSYVNNPGRNYTLDNFNTNVSILPYNEVKQYVGFYERLSPLSKKLYNDYCPIAYKRFFKEKYINTSPSKLLKAKSGFFDGYWSNLKYFTDIQEQIKAELTLKTEFITPLLVNVREEVQSMESVAIHIRRGDYVQHPKYSQIFAVLGLDYYYRAIKTIFQKLSSPVFYIFTDDVEWARTNLTLPDCTVKFIDDYKLDKDILEFDIMCHCKHFITANSTFSWWGAWLGKHPEKIVIGPKYRYKDTQLQKKFEKGENTPVNWVLI